MQAGAAMLEKALETVAAAEILVTSSLVHEEDHAQDKYTNLANLNAKLYKDSYRQDVITAVQRNYRAISGEATTGLSKKQYKALAKVKRQQIAAGNHEKGVVEAGSVYRQYRANFEKQHTFEGKEWGHDSHLVSVYHHRLARASAARKQRRQQRATLKVLSHFGSCSGCMGDFGPCFTQLSKTKLCCNYNPTGVCPPKFTDCNPTMQKGQKIRLGLLWKQEKLVKNVVLAPQQQQQAQLQDTELMHVVGLWTKAQAVQKQATNALKNMRRYEMKKGKREARRRKAVFKRKVRLLNTLELLEVELKKLQAKMPALHAHTPAPTPASSKGCRRCTAAGQPCISHTNQGVLSCDPPDPASGNCPAGSTKCDATLVDDAH
jgi:hypothetical protein